MRKPLPLAGLILLMGGLAHGAGLSQRAKSFTLENGMTFWVYERHQIPTFFGIYMAKTGSCDEQAGETGLAHFSDKNLLFRGRREFRLQPLNLPL